MNHTPVLDTAHDVLDRLRARVLRSVTGRDETVELVLVALLAGGHVLLEDYPGSGKTTLAKAIGAAITGGGDLPAMRRIQFTPDLLPADITGTTIFQPDTRSFTFRAGPVFAHVVLADEINRTSPKVQAALLEAMGERQVTVDGETRPLDDLFFVIATQNPLDLAGTWPLPVSQLDRFLLRIRMKPIAAEAELHLLDNLEQFAAGADDSLPRVSRDDLLAARAALSGIRLAPQIKKCLVDLAEATRHSDRCLQGLSTRALVLAVPALRGMALSRGRDWVSADDLDALAPHLFTHRVMVAPGAGEPEDVIGECLAGPMEQLARSTLK
jgi:MoxR-like ATPase